MDTRLSQLEREVTSMIVIVDKLDNTMEKLTEISSNVSQLLAVQEKRLELNEKSIDKLEASAEKAKTEVDSRFNQAQEKLLTVQVDFKKEIKDNQEKICEQLDDLITKFDTSYDGIDKRIGKIEKWMWGLIGAGILLGYMLNLFISTL